MSDDFRHRTRVEVRFRDIDAFGHVNNAVIASYLEQARVMYLHDVLGFDPVGRMPMILANLAIDYAAPIFWGEGVEVDSRVDWIGTTSLSMSHEIYAAGRLAAEARTVLVTYDYESERPIPVPDTWRAAFADWEGRELVRPMEAAPASSH